MPEAPLKSTGLISLKFDFSQSDKKIGLARIKEWCRQELFAAFDTESNLVVSALLPCQQGQRGDLAAEGGESGDSPLEELSRLPYERGLDSPHQEAADGPRYGRGLY
ncbi:MAG: hypothetical protein AAGL24_25225 [Pseudomonadota bacterium]